MLRVNFQGYIDASGMIGVEAPIPNGMQFPRWDGSQWVIGEDIAIQPKIEVPQEVTMRQARLELLSRGKLDAVQPAINSIADPMQKQAAQIEWDYSNAVQRNHPFVINLGLALGLDLDAVFIEAAKR